MILIDRCSAHKHAISSSIRLILTIYHRPSRPTMLGAAARPGEHFSSGEGSRLIAQSIACNSILHGSGPAVSYIDVGLIEVVCL